MTTSSDAAIATLDSTVAQAAPATPIAGAPSRPLINIQLTITFNTFAPMRVSMIGRTTPTFCR